MKIQRALSIRQPYAEQIMRGTKKIEYRSRPTHVRERVYIYASTKPGDPDIFAQLRCEPGDLPTGVLIGTVEIVDCTGSTGDYEWHLAHPKRLARNLKPTRQPQPAWFFPFGANAPSRVSRQTEIRSQRPPGIDRTDFVAYHSMDKMGYAFTPGKDCGYYSRKPRSFLESAIGSDTWMITGTRDALKRMIYKLVGVYVPAEVRDESESYFVWGRRVARFQRPIELNALNWFARLLQEQNNFSFGFNSIRNKEVLNALRALRRKHVGRTEA